MPNQNKTEIQLNKVTFVRPGGNDTAIVWDNVACELQSDVSTQIQSHFKNIEQVMFVERDGETLRGQMAGGEFCGNATRSLGYLLLEGEDGAITLNVSGTNKPQSITVSDKFARTSIPILNDVDCVQIDKDGYQVMMDGIAFQIMDKTDPITKAQAMDILNRKGLSRRYPASGLILLEKIDDNVYAIDPYVYVRGTGTLYYETGCGSGSTAVGLMLSKQSGKSLSDIEIRQPSGMSLYVSIERNSQKFVSASVNGPIEILSQQAIKVSLPNCVKPKVA